MNEFAERGTRRGFTLITIPDFRASPTVPVTICQIKRIPTPGDVEPPERSEFCWMLVDRDISLGMICGPEKERDACSNPTTGPREPPNQRQLVTSVRVCLSSTPGRKYDLDLGAREAR